MPNNKKTYCFHVHGMHCQSCVVLTENELQTHPNVSSVKSSLSSLTVEVSGDFGDASLEVIAEELAPLIAPHGYHLSLEPEKKKINWKEFKIAVPIAFAFALGFIILQKLGIVNLVNASEVTYGTAFVIGIIASLSTCMAVVGGLVLSMSASFAKTGDRVKPQTLFHVGRLVSFFILGGVIGALGAFVQFGAIGTFVLNLLVGLVMLLLGLNLLDLFHITKKLQPAMPKFFSRHIFGLTKANHTLTPMLVGVATFFLPCGFTQSMQIYTLSTGSFLSGALTMGVFALGTLPVLALLSFSSLRLHEKAASGVFFKTAGLVVILFALFNILNGFVIIGVLPPLFDI